MLLVLLLLRWMELRLRHGRLGRCRAVGRDVRHGSLLRAGPEALEGGAGEHDAALPRARARTMCALGGARLSGL